MHLTIKADPEKRAASLNSPYVAGVLGDVILLPRDGSTLVQIGSDPGLFGAPVRHNAIELAPAKRSELIVDFARYDSGQTVRLVNEFGDGRTAEVMQFRVGDRMNYLTVIPDQLSAFTKLRAEDSTVTRTMMFRSQTIKGMSGWTINGKTFSTTQIHASPVLNQLETWRLISDFHHPIHLHLSPFQVLSRGTRRPGEPRAGLCQN